MAKIEGMLILEALAQRVDAGKIDTVLVAFTDIYGGFMGKRFDAGFFLEEIAEAGTHGCDYLLTVDMEMQPVPGYDFANWERGYGDFHLVPDLPTLRVASWLENSALVVCDLVDDKSHQRVGQGPRSMLHRQLDKAADLGFSACGASELEYYIFENSYRDAARKTYHELEPAG